MNTNPNPSLDALRDVWFQRPDGRALEVEVLRVEDLLSRKLRHNLERAQRIHFHELMLVEAGTSTHMVDFETLSVGAGALVLVHEGSIQAFDPARTLQGPSALFTSSFLDAQRVTLPRLVEAKRLLFAAGPVVLLGEHSLTRAALCFETLRCVTNEAQGRFVDEAVAASFALLLFDLAGLPEVAAAAGASEPEDPLVARFVRLLEERYTLRESAHSYARRLHVSVRTLDRRLVAAISVTARQAIAARTLLEARRMLADRDLAIKFIASEVGFSEPHNFARFFKSQTGMSPRSFREGLHRTKDGEAP